MKASLSMILDLGEPRMGVWCPTCLLPAAASVDVLRITSRGVSHLTTSTVCSTCGPIRGSKGV